MYVCQLQKSKQDEIISKCCKVFESLAYKVDIVDDVMHIIKESD